MYHLDNPDTDIHVGDCRAVIERFPNEHFDLVFADPPFNWGVRYQEWEDDMPRERYLAFTYEWLDACVRVLKARGSIWVNIPDDTAAEIVVHLKQRGLHMVNWCIWHFRFGQHRSTNFIVSKAHVLYFAKDRHNRIWNPDDVLVPTDRASVYGDRRTLASQRAGYRVPLDVWYGDNLGRIQGNNKERRAAHQNQIPELYMERIVRACSLTGHCILDPFLGSGTTCAVARALGRRSVGIECSDTIAASAFERVKHGAIRVGKRATRDSRTFRFRAPRPAR